MKLIMGCDDYGLELANILSEHLIENGYEIVMVDPRDESVDYPEIAETVALAVSDGQYEKARESLEDVLKYAQSLGCEILGTASQAFLAIVMIAEGHFHHGIKILEEKTY